MPRHADLAISTSVPIPQQALPQWKALAVGLQEMGPAPCERTPAETPTPRMCGACPVRDLCLDYALTADEREGVWGGLTGPQRQALAQTLAIEVQTTTPPAQHGEERKYAAGCRCQQCRHTHARRVADWRKRREYAQTTKAA